MNKFFSRTIPVKRTGKRCRYSGSWFRHLKIIRYFRYDEMVSSLLTEVDINIKPITNNRKLLKFSTEWDGPARNKQRSWKKYRKHQWKEKGGRSPFSFWCMILSFNFVLLA